LAEVKRIAEKVIANTATMGLGLSACTVPAAGKPGFELADDEIEMGLGIHGEPGVQKVKMKPVKDLVKDLISTINEQLKLNKGDKIAVIVNGMGSTPLMELYIAAKNTKEELDTLGVDIRLFKTGNYMTSIDMHGMSITLCKLDDELESLLKESQETMAW
ncbi:MAG: dihydroxyacetone kinase subunit DhaK, partial [Malacoplasma sp.]|nr:dihydroxyacetone kinase subunit DhaK [Malacoplasma sp.]